MENQYCKPYNYTNPQPAEQQYQEAKKTFGIISLICGIVAVLCCISFILGVPAGITGIVMGCMSLKKKEASKGLPIAGIITSSLGILLTIILLIFVITMGYIGNKASEFKTVWDKEWGEFVEDSKNYIEDIPDGDIDIEYLIVGHTYKLDDDSVIKFYDDYRFIWWKDAYSEDNYYAGTYSVYYGEDAKERITEDLTQFAVTEEELDAYFERNEGDEIYSIENLTLIELDHTEVVFDGVEEDMSDYDTTISYYYGFYDTTTKKLDAANMATGTYYLFERQ